MSPGGTWPGQVDGHPDSAESPGSLRNLVKASPGGFKKTAKIKNPVRLEKRIGFENDESFSPL
jgi:hypothetical protein